MNISISHTFVAAAVLSMTVACAKNSATSTPIGEAPAQPSSVEVSTADTSSAPVADADYVIPSIQGLPAVTHAAEECPVFEGGFYQKKNTTDKKVTTFAVFKKDGRPLYRMVGMDFIADGRLHTEGQGPRYLAVCAQGRLSVYMVQESAGGSYQLQGTLLLESQGNELKAGVQAAGASGPHTTIYEKRADSPAVGEV